MSEQVYTDVFDAEVVLTDTVRAVILTKHPEVAEFIENIGEVLLTPDEVRRSIRDERQVLYYRYEEVVLSGKWVVVVVKRIDRNFVSTVYATDRIKSGEVIWTK
jgi:hypothetical protein